jgi:hypothetical protein
MRKGISPKKTKNDFELYNLSVWYCSEDNNFYWDEDCIDGQELIKAFKDKYGVLKYYGFKPDEKDPWDGIHIEENTLTSKAHTKHLQEHTNKSYKSSQELLNRLIA